MLVRELVLQLRGKSRLAGGCCDAEDRGRGTLSPPGTKGQIKHLAIRSPPIPPPGRAQKDPWGEIFGCFIRQKAKPLHLHPGTEHLTNIHLQHPGISRTGQKLHSPARSQLSPHLFTDPPTVSLPYLLLGQGAGTRQGSACPSCWHTQGDPELSPAPLRSHPLGSPLGPGHGHSR